MKKTILVLLLFTGLVFISCPAVEAPDPIPEPAVLEVVPGAIKVAVGGTGNLAAVIMPGYRPSQGGFWESSNEGIAVVNNEGVVTGISTGL